MNENFIKWDMYLKFCNCRVAKILPNIKKNIYIDSSFIFYENIKLKT